MVPTSPRLADAIATVADSEGAFDTPLEGLHLYRQHRGMARQSVIYAPSICVVAQGAKNLYVGDACHRYDSNNYLISSLTMPIEVEIANASEQNPYLGLVLSIDRPTISQLIAETESALPLNQNQQQPGIISSSPLTNQLEQAFIRLISLLREPMDLKILGPGLVREIFYEVLRGPHGALLRNCVYQDSRANRIASAVHYIEENFHQSLDIEQIAQQAGMSSSSLHDYFKKATAMSPMQFVKSLRLHQARMMLISGSKASEVSFKVGYSSPSQFSREFKRFFGESPSQVGV